VIPAARGVALPPRVLAEIPPVRSVTCPLEVAERVHVHTENEPTHADENFTAGNFRSGHSASMASVKHLFDLVAVLAAAPAALLLVGVAAIAIAITSGRPIFFIQERVGLRGRVFRMIKLRTMSNGHKSGSVAASVQDRRVTPLGAVLRQYRIDELPQLINVLKGDMSLIGPRPEQPQLVEEYRKVLTDFDDRHLVKPGITGLAQVMYGYASNAEETRIKLKYDRFYVQNSSVSMEARIIAKTISTVLRCEGAR
jgi:lipopolysaccharide/colanic/teichoic acid biosynthesis glycosyltransferase